MKYSINNLAKIRAFIFEKIYAQLLCDLYFCKANQLPSFLYIKLSLFILCIYYESSTEKENKKKKINNTPQLYTMENVKYDNKKLKNMM